jgi:hypothetical protein
MEKDIRQSSNLETVENQETEPFHTFNIQHPKEVLGFFASLVSGDRKQAAGVHADACFCPTPNMIKSMARTKTKNSMSNNYRDRPQLKVYAKASMFLDH